MSNTTSNLVLSRKLNPNGLLNRWVSKSHPTCGCKTKQTFFKKIATTTAALIIISNSPCLHLFPSIRFSLFSGISLVCQAENEKKGAHNFFSRNDWTVELHQTYSSSTIVRNCATSCINRRHATPADFHFLWFCLPNNCIYYKIKDMIAVLSLHLKNQASSLGATRTRTLKFNFKSDFKTRHVVYTTFVSRC